MKFSYDFLFLAMFPRLALDPWLFYLSFQIAWEYKHKPLDSAYLKDFININISS